VHRALPDENQLLRRVLVVTGLDFKNSGSNSASVSAELQNGVITLDAKPRKDNSTAESFRSNDAYVLGADTVEKSKLTNLRLCDSELVVLSHNGSSSARAYAIGPYGKHYYEKTSEAGGDADVNTGRVSIEKNDPLVGDPSAEIFDDLEANAGGKWLFGRENVSITFLRGNDIEPAMKRWHNSNHHEVVAGAGAEVESVVNLRLANRMGDKRRLQMPLWRSLEKAIVRRQSGEETHKYVPWAGIEAHEQFELGLLGPGEVVDLQFENNLLMRPLSPTSQERLSRKSSSSSRFLPSEFFAPK